MTPEGALKLQVVAFLELTEIFWMRFNSGTVRKGSRFIKLHKNGTADMGVFRPGRTIWIELKVEGQKTTKERQKEQADFAEKVRSVGHEYHIVRSIQELQDVLSQPGPCSAHPTLRRSA